MSPSERRSSTPISTTPVELKRSRTSPNSNASFRGQAATVKNRLNRAHEIAQSLNRQLGNLLHFIEKSSFLAITESEDQPQEILWVASRRSGPFLSDELAKSDKNLKSGESVEAGQLKSEKGVAELPAHLRAKVESFVGEQTQGIQQEAQPPLESATPHKAWSYDVLLLRPDHEVVPEATISYPAVRLNADGDVCFLADVYPEKLRAAKTAAKTLDPLDQNLGQVPPQGTDARYAHSDPTLSKDIGVVQLFWEALIRAGITAKIPLNIKND